MPNADIDTWVDRIERGTRYKENYGNSKRWSVYRDYGRGKFPGFNSDAKGILPYNLTYAMEKATVPNVYYRNPYMTVSPGFMQGYQMNSKIIESIDNWLIQEMNIKQTMKTCVADAYYTNRGIIKLGYDSIAAGSQPQPRSINERIAQIMNTPVSQLGKRKAERVEYNTDVKPGLPWASRIMPDYIVVPFGVRRLGNCSWIDHISIRELDDVKNDPKYTDTANLSGTHLEMVYKNIHTSNLYKEIAKDADLVEIHEIRDFKRKEIKAFVPGYDKWIRKPQEDVLQYEGLPYVDFTFNEDTEYYWGPSDVQIIEPQQLEINESKTQAMYHRRIALLKFLYEKGKIKPEAVDKMLSETVGPGIEVNGAPKDSVAILQPHIPPDLMQWVESIRSEVRELLGHSRQDLGEAPPGRRTKFEMQMVRGGGEIRMDERRDIVATALVQLMRKVNQIIFDKWTTDQVAQVVGFDGAKYWIKYNPRQIRGEYALRVDVESMTPKTKTMKKQEIVQLIQALAKNPRANIDYLMMLLLREYEWIDAMNVFPEAAETQQRPMEMNQFLSHQQNMVDNKPMLEARASNNASTIGRFFG